MMEGVETRLEGTTLVIRVPMRFEHRGGRKRIVAPDGISVTLHAAGIRSLVAELASESEDEKALMDAAD
jgi:hypothetical protein